MKQFFMLFSEVLHMIYITKPSLPQFEEYTKEISSLWNSRILTNMGKKHQELESALCDFLRAKNTELFANGHLALEAALQVFDFPKGSEIITTPFTFISTTNAITRSGFTPVFCDIKESDGTINTTLIESLITEKTVAILPVHVYGNLCDVDKIAGIANKHNLRIIYDAAHAFGVTNAGSFGDVSMFSFHATKVFHTVEGGCLTFKDSSLAEKLQALRNFGYINGEIVSCGGNAKMSEFHAAMGLCNLRHIDEYIAKRKKKFELYCQLLSDCPSLRIITSPNYSYMPLCVELRDRIFNTLAENNIIARKYFELTSNSANTPIAKKISDEIITLPLYPDLEESSIEKICKIIKGAIK
jgi:dTDP-4-amino-4,6-dideoxygalactose transaminase